MPKEAEDSKKISAALTCRPLSITCLSYLRHKIFPV